MVVITIIITVIIRYQYCNKQYTHTDSYILYTVYMCLCMFVCVCVHRNKNQGKEIQNRYRCRTVVIHVSLGTVCREKNSNT